MSDRERRDDRRVTPRKAKSAAASQTRIEWSRGLSNEQMDAVLQEALLKTRASNPRTHDVVLLEEVVHELKSRLNRYHEIMGPVPSREESEEV